MNSRPCDAMPPTTTTMPRSPRDALSQSTEPDNWLQDCPATARRRILEFRGAAPPLTALIEQPEAVIAFGLPSMLTLHREQQRYPVERKWLKIEDVRVDKHG